MNTSQNKVCFAQFKFCQKTCPGEEIHITGNIPSLGNWDVNKCEKMVTNQQEYPMWKTKENIIVQQDTEIQYKYLYFRGGKFVGWETNPNRHVTIGKFYKVVIMDPGSKIIHSINAPNLNNITNSEISKCENNYYDDDKIFNTEDIGLGSIDLNNDLFSEQNMNTNNNEEQYILSNKRNDLILGLQEKQLNTLYEDLNVDNSNSNLNINNENNNNLNNSYNHNYNLNNINFLENIINEIEPINCEIFKNIIINENQKCNENNKDNNKELNLLKIDSNISEIEYKISGNVPLICNDDSKNELILVNSKEPVYKKYIICSFYLPIEIKNEKIIPICDYIYPNLFKLKKYSDNIYFIGFIKNYNNIDEKNKKNIISKLINEYKMFPLEIDSSFKNEILNYFDEKVNPFLNNIKIKIYDNISFSINEIHYKFNQIIYKKIIELAGNEKTLLLLFDYYYIFIPWLIMKGDSDEDIQNDKIDKFNNNFGIQYIFLNQMPYKNKLIKIPKYQNIIKSLLYSNVISFPSYNNCFNFLNIIKLFEGIEYHVNMDGDIILIVNNNKNQSNNHDCLKKFRNVILRIENILPDYQMFKSILNESEENLNLEIDENLQNLIKKDNYLIFLSIDDIKYLSFIKIKFLGFKLFIDEPLDEKQKIIFIQVITGVSKNKNNIYNNININAEKQEKGNDNLVTIEQINSIANEINSSFEYKIIEIYHKDINIYEKLFLLNKADCFIKTSDDINSPLSIYEYLMVKLIEHKNKREKYANNKDEKNNIKINNNKNTNTNKIFEKGEKQINYPIIEYIISNQIKEIPGLNKYIYVNPFEIKNISNGLTKAYRNLIKFHKNKNNINFLEEHSKENDFNFIKKYFYNDKFHYYKYNYKDYQNNITNINIINDNKNKIKLNKIDINNIIKDYCDSINFISQDNDKEQNNIFKIISINLDYFLSNYSTKKENENNQKLYELFSNLTSIALNNDNNKIILFSQKDQFDLDDIIHNYIEQNNQKFRQISINNLKNFIIASSNGYSFTKISNFLFEEDINKWGKLLIYSEELKYSEKDILNNIVSYKQNCNNMKIVPKSNKIFIYNDDCNKEQIDIYMDKFKNEIESNDNLKHILVVNKISNGYCIENTLNYKALFISKLIKEIISKDKQPKFILYLGFNQSDEILYKYLDEKKSSIEKYSKTNIYTYSIKLINSKELINENNNFISQEQNYKNLFYEDNINEIITLLKRLADSEKR